MPQMPECNTVFLRCCFDNTIIIRPCTPTIDAVADSEFIVGQIYYDGNNVCWEGRVSAVETHYNSVNTYFEFTPGGGCAACLVDHTSKCESPNIIPLPTCSCADIDIEGKDLNDAVGNTDPAVNGVVFVDMYNCQLGQTVSYSFGVLGTYSMCVYILDPTPYLYINDVKTNAANSTVTVTGYMCNGPGWYCTPPLSPTPTPTPTSTLTPTPTPTVPPIFAYVVPEPQDNGDSSTSVYKLGSYMYYLSDGVTIDTNVDWYGYSSGGWADPTNPHYSYMMDKYISYSGFTLGSDGNFMTPVSSFNGLIKQSPGVGTDGYGCSINQYTFETITISTLNINPNEYYFYSVWIPLSGVGGVMKNMTIGVGYMSYPCSFDLLLTPATTISTTDITVTSGAAIPAGVYRVLYCSVSTLLPPSTPSTNNFYFKGETKS